MIALVRAGHASGDVRDSLHAAEVAMTLNWAILQVILLWSSTAGAEPSLGWLVRRRLLIAMHGVAIGDGEGV
ncbi:MAG: hypothetical protein KDB02_01775 [Acidimicrobiales bacterium]|nr:hypothetical protein [Acidimicrobiales bacterium]